MSRFPLVSLVLLLLLLNACTPASTKPAGVSITSHADGQVITDSHDVTITAKLTNAVAAAVITAELNGVAITPVRTDDLISVVVVLAEGANTVSFTVANPGQTPPAGATLNLDHQPAPAPVASVSVTSHADGQVITGSRDVTVTAELTDAVAGAVITAELNGELVVATRSGETVSVTVALADHANTLIITVANPDQDALASASLSVDYPFISLSNGQEATLVIGQPDFTTTDETESNRSFRGIYGRPLLADGILYLPDYSADRVLGYLGVPDANGAAADFVLGKPDFDATGSIVSSSVFDGSQTVISDGQRLFVTDYSSDRILVYDSLPTTSGAAADHVIGQADFTSTDSDCSAIRFDSLESATVVDGKLIVADSGNNRVLIWNSIPTAIDTPANLVLGQGSMATCTANDDDQDGDSDTLSSKTMDYPSDVWSDGERLVVADADNNRVLIWNEFPTSNFEEADIVLGQSGFTTNVYAAGPGGLDYPYFLHSNGNQLFVADSANNRVLIWNEFPTRNGQEADVVLGQADMTANSEDAGGSVSSSGLDFVTGVYAYGNRLFVGDNGNDRYLVFEGTNP